MVAQGVALVAAKAAVEMVAGMEAAKGVAEREEVERVVVAPAVGVEVMMAVATVGEAMEAGVRVAELEVVQG